MGDMSDTCFGFSLTQNPTSVCWRVSVCALNIAIQFSNGNDYASMTGEWTSTCLTHDLEFSLGTSQVQILLVRLTSITSRLLQDPTGSIYISPKPQAEGFLCDLCNT